MRGRFEFDRVTSASAFIAWSLLTVLTALALVRPSFHYDAWWYHLPFSALAWGIGGTDAFHLDPFLRERFAGFPRVWHLLQGALWWITGWLPAVIVPQILLCAAYFIFVRRILGVPYSWIILGFFACPMLVLHYQVTYLDLPAGIAVAVFFFASLGLVATQSNRAAWLLATSAMASAGLAGNIKVQGFLACVVVSAVVMSACAMAHGLRSRRVVILMSVLMTANLLAGASAGADLVRFGNPFYPINVEIAGHTVFSGPEASDAGAEPPRYLLSGSREIALPGFANFILSATQVDWVLRGVAPWYNIDSVTGRSPRRGPPSRTGGWGDMFVLVNIGLLAIQSARQGLHQDRLQRILVVGAVLLVVLTSFLPRAHELRYWLYLPLVLMPVNLRFVFAHRAGSSLIHGALVVLVGYSLMTTFLSPKSALLQIEPVTEMERRAQVPLSIIQALEKKGVYCDPDNNSLFRYSFAVTGLHGLLSRDQRDCPLPSIESNERSGGL